MSISTSFDLATRWSWRRINFGKKGEKYRPRHRPARLVKFGTSLMRQIPKTELSPDNGCVIDTKWNVPPLKYYACAAAEGDAPTLTEAPPMPEVIIYDHAGFRGAYARTNLSFLYLGDVWNEDRKSV